LLLAQSSGSHRVYPRRYLHAALETIVITLIVTWAFTWKFHSDQIWKHPKFITLGAFNYCFGWDFPPGNFIAAFLNSFIVYFLWRYAILVNMRLAMHRPVGGVVHHWVHRFYAFWTYMHALSASCFLLIWLFGPISTYDTPAAYATPPGWGAHTVAFFCFVFASWFSYVGAYFESKYSANNTVKPKHTYYIIAFSISTILMMFLYPFQQYMEDNGPYGKNHPDVEKCVPTESLFLAAKVHCSYLSGQWIIVANWFWFFSFIAAPYFTPSQPHLTESYQIGEDDDDDETALAGIQMH